MTVSENYIGLGRAGKRHSYNFSSFPWFSYSALLCRAGVCGKRLRLAGERLAVSQLENGSSHSCDEHEGTQAQTCLWRLVRGTSSTSRGAMAEWCHAAAQALERDWVPPMLCEVAWGGVVGVCVMCVSPGPLPAAP